jgi:hypothetical protein
MNMTSADPEFVDTDLKLKIPSGILISGSSSSGKTALTIRLIEQREEIFSPSPQTVLYCYGEFHQIVPYLESIGVSTYSGVPSSEQIDALSKPSLIILDDLMYNINQQFLNDLYTKQSHHKNFTIITLCQNLFDKVIKIPRLNSMYIFLLRAPNSLISVRSLGTQIYPRQLPFFIDSYNQATNEQYGYLMIDMHPSSRPILRLRTHIFPGEQTYVFVPKNNVD